MKWRKKEKEKKFYKKTDLAQYNVRHIRKVINQVSAFQSAVLVLRARPWPLLQLLEDQILVSIMCSLVSDSSA